MSFRQLAKYLAKLEKISSRIEITKILAELLKKTGRTDADKTVYLLLGILAPSYRSIVFNFAERLAQISNLKSQISKSSVSEVYNELVKIAKIEGEGSVGHKTDSLAVLISKLDPLSAKFVVRIPLGRLRLGFSDKTLLDALSWMEAGDKSLKSQLDKAYEVIPDVGLLAKQVKELGVARATKDVMPIVGVPVMPMLAQRLK